MLQDDLHKFSYKIIVVQEVGENNKGGKNINLLTHAFRCSEGEGRLIDRLPLSDESSFPATDYMNDQNKLLNISNNKVETVNRPWCNVALLEHKLSDRLRSFCPQG
jgi:hypothetical protein